MITMVILGYGNVGSALCREFAAYETIQLTVYNRTPIKRKDQISEVTYVFELSELPEADVYVMAISDDQISDLSSSLPFNDRLVVHTSGGVSVNALAPQNRKGVFYPLQTFSSGLSTNFKDIPICIEAENEADLELLQSIAECISEKVVTLPSEKRQKVHLAAVFVNNFTNHLYALAEDYLTNHDLDFSLLQPLIQETSEKIKTLSPMAVQTGPAKRGDQNTIQKHLELLKEHPELEEFYKLLSANISTKHGH